MKKKKKVSSICKPQVKNTCSIKKEIVTPCNPIEVCKPKKCYKEYVTDCDCEITVVDKCVEMAKKAEELFERALECEINAQEAYEKATECDKTSKILTQKAKKLLSKVYKSEKESKEAECMAKELLEKAEKLIVEAKCLKKQGISVEHEAECNCNNAKELYEKAQEFNNDAKYLYEQAKKCDEKALKCYKEAGIKIKEYELKSKKCEDMLFKCNDKLSNCKTNLKSVCDEYIIPVIDNCGCDEYEEYEYIDCTPMHPIHPCEYECKTPIPKQPMIIKEDCNMCQTYVTPMYDMAPMQYMGYMGSQYPTMDMPYIDANITQGQDINEMWMNYYMMMQNMMAKNFNYINK